MRDVAKGARSANENRRSARLPCLEERVHQQVNVVLGTFLEKNQLVPKRS
jgi:hypothetical protein